MKPHRLFPASISPQPDPSSRRAAGRRRLGLAVHLALALALVVAGVAGPARAQEEARAEADENAVFEGRTEVVEVQVPVTVVDRDGNPVRGLTREDFVIEDEGDRREIVDFRVVDLERMVAREPGRVSELERQLPSAARRHFLLLFDLSFSDPTSLVRAREAARQLVLEELHPTDLAAVAVYSAEAGARLLVTFTPDRAQLARAIDTMGARDLLREELRDPLAFMIENPNSLGTEFSRGMLSTEQRRSGEGPSAELGAEGAVLAHLRVLGKQFDRSNRSFERSRISAWSQGLEDLGRALDSVRGRKQILLFSEGFDSSLMVGRLPDAEDDEAVRDQLSVAFGQSYLVDSDQVYGSTGLQREVAEMLEGLRRSDSVIQAVDIGGLRAGADIRDQIGNAGQDSLFYLANETGGELFKDANDLEEQLATVLDRSSVTYLLTFRADDLPTDGSYRRLDVDVEGHRSSRINHRDGYYTPRPFQELHPLERSLLASDAIASAVPVREIETDLLAVPFMASDARAYVPVILEVDGEDLLTGHTEPNMGVEIYTYVTNEEGQMQDFFSELITLDTIKGREALVSGGVKYYGSLSLPPGQYLVRTLVRNANTGRSGITTTELKVPEYGTDTALLLPPMFLEEPGRWVLVREPQPEGRESVIYPFTVNGQPFIPSARPVLDSGDRASLCLMAYNMEGDLEITTRVRNAEGTMVEGGRLSLDERTVTGIRGVDKLLATFRPRGLDVGPYTLEIEIADSNGAVDVASIPFTVER